MTGVGCNSQSPRQQKTGLVPCSMCLFKGTWQSITAGPVVSAPGHLGTWNQLTPRGPTPTDSRRPGKFNVHVGLVPSPPVDQPPCPCCLPHTTHLLEGHLEASCRQQQVGRATGDEPSDTGHTLTPVDTHTHTHSHTHSQLAETVKSSRGLVWVRCEWYPLVPKFRVPSPKPQADWQPQPEKKVLLL